jgi:hypothetical protein
MTDKKKFNSNMRKIETIIKDYMKENNVSLADLLSDKNFVSYTVVDNCKFKVAFNLQESVKVSRELIFVYIEGMRQQK